MKRMFCPTMTSEPPMFFFHIPQRQAFVIALASKTWQWHLSNVISLWIALFFFLKPKSDKLCLEVSGFDVGKIGLLFHVTKISTEVNYYYTRSNAALLVCIYRHAYHVS